MDTADVPDFGAVCNNLAAYTWADRCAAFSHCESTSYVPWLWLYHCSISERFDFSSAAVIVQIVCDIALTPFVIFFGAKLLVKVAEVLFGPSLEDICTQCKVPQRTAAIIFMALANGAPDMAGAIVAISNPTVNVTKRVDMAFGALLGAGCFVITYVLARILEDMPETRVIAANAAFFRDVLSFALPVAALPLIRLTTGGITVPIATCFIIYYALLTCLVAYGDFWHHHMDRYLPQRVEAAMARVRSFFGMRDVDLDDGFDFLESPASSARGALLDLGADHSDSEDLEEQGSVPRASPEDAGDANPVQQRLAAAMEQKHALNLGLLQAYGDDADLRAVAARELSHNLHAGAQARAARGGDQVGALPQSAFHQQSNGAFQGAPGPQELVRLSSSNSVSTPSLHPSESASQQVRRPPARFELEPIVPRSSSDTLNPRPRVDWCCWHAACTNFSKSLLVVLLPPGAADDDEDDGDAFNSNGAAAADIDDFDWGHFGDMSRAQQALVLALALFMVPFRLFTPTLARTHYDPYLLVLAMGLMPPAFVTLVWGVGACSAAAWNGVAVLSAVLAAATYAGFVPHAWNQNAPLGHPPKWVYVEVSVGVFSVPIIIAAFSVLTMTMAVLVIQLVAGELIGSLYAVGLLTKCPEALLGVGLAIINSMGDLATNLAAARRSERMAFASCFSSQAFNLLLAPAIGAIVSLKESRLDVLPLEFGPIVWVMIVGLLIYFVVLLAAATLGSGNSAIGEPYTLPHGFHAVASMAFKLFVVAVLVVAAPSWIRALL